MKLERVQREFLAEAADIVDHLTAGLAAIDAERRQGPPEPAKLNEVFRQAHSLKGLAGMSDVEDMSRIAHQMETILDGMRLGRLQLDDRLMDVLYGCTDAFGQLLGDVKEGRPLNEATIAALTGRLEEAAQETKAVVAPVAVSQMKLAPEALAALTEYEEHRLNENLRAATPVYRAHAPMPFASFETDLKALTAAINDLGELLTTLPSTDDSGRFIIFDLVFASSAPASIISECVSSLGSYALERIDRPATRAPQPAVSSAPRSVAPHSSAPHAGVRDAPSLLPMASEDEPHASLRQVTDTVRVDIGKLDELMGIVGELVLARGGLTRVSTELKQEIGYRGLAIDLHRLVRILDRRIVDLQNAIMQVRMVPLSQVFERLSRTVRRAASALGKEVELIAVGEETELDKLIIEDLIDPLMHLVRNCVDHGIELPDARIAAGKPACGRIELRAYPRGSHVIIDIVDDGRGIDEVAVKRAALARGIVDDDHIGRLSRRDVWNLIFSPGFTTRKEVSETSGRGVGLDVVKTNVAKLSGLIDVESVPGKGTRFTITLPITLAIIQAVIIRSARRVYALPLASVLEIVVVQPADLYRIEGKEMLQLRGQTLPVLRLDRLFHPTEAREQPTDEGGDGYAAVVGLAQHRAALIVDDVLGQQDVVIKSLGAYLAAVKGIAGATHLGDHETILVLDVAALVQELLHNDDVRSRSLRGDSPHGQGERARARTTQPRPPRVGG